MIVPTVHMNGTSKESLVKQLCEASHALNSAYHALKQAAPNARDYYPQGPDAFEKAVAEHMARLKKIDDVKDEIDAMSVAIYGG